MKTKDSQNYLTGPLDFLEAEIAIAALNASGEFTVLRKLNLEKDPRFTHRHAQGSKIGLCIDTETTGLNHNNDKIIELGIVAFEFNQITSEIVGIVGRYNGFEDPGCPLAKEIKDLTGITDEMLAGHVFDDAKVNSLASMADLVIAHNAAFDRKFVESRYPSFSNLPWSCTVSQIDWQQERISSRTLEYLLYKCGGYFINAHRALDDAEGLLGLLLGNLPVTELPIFKALLEKSGEVTSKIHAVNAPFDKKDILKQRGYRWNDGTKNGCKAWWVDVQNNMEQEELSFLARDIYPSGNTRSVVINRIDPYSRFSIREC